MKFAEHLAAHITPEWRKQYIQYEEMKAKLADAVQEAPSAELVEPEVLQRYFAKFDEAFFTFCDKELNKINVFYAEKLAEAQRKYTTLSAELSLPSQLDKKEVRFLSLKSGTERISGRKLQDLKLAFSEYYLSLVLLQNYQNLNYTGFRKILKKHDKNLTTDSGAKWRSENVDSAMFYVNKEIDKLIQDTESTFINELEGGDRTKAMKRLRVPPLGDKHASPWTTFKLGFFCGAFIILLIAVALSGIFYNSMPSVAARNDWPIVIRLFRGPLLVIIMIFLIGINVYGWGAAGVNHVLIFELDPRNHLSYQHLMELGAILGVIWTLHLLLFLYSEFISIPAYASPLSLIVIMTMFFINPTRTLMPDARFWLLKVIGRIFGAPFFYVGFADFWIADQLNSLATVFTDFHFAVCFYTSENSTIDGDFSVASGNYESCIKGNWIRAIVASLPAWFRFAQCLRRYKDSRDAFPHLVNAGKYSTTFFTVLFSFLNAYFIIQYPDTDTFTPFFYLYLISKVISSLYTYTWDIKMDWGFAAKNAGENTFLREEIVYNSKNYYYFAIIEDLILRFSWTLTVSLTQTGYVFGDLAEWLITILAIFEVFRRFIWNFFRLENEHLNNCGNFRAVRDISVAPIDASDQADIIKMMDEPEGVKLVRKRKTTKGQSKNKVAADLLKPLLENEQFSSLAANI